MEFFHLSTEGDLADEDQVLVEGWPDGFPDMKGYCMAMGDPASAFWPDDAWIFLRPENPGIKVGDLLGNTDSYLLVSPRMKQLLEQHCGADGYEYLRFTLGDHRRRALAKDRYCINPVGAIACLDPTASGVVLDDDGEVEDVDRYVIDARKLAGAKHLFRIGEAPTEYVVSQQLADAITAAGFSNVLLDRLETV